MRGGQSIVPFRGLIAKIVSPLQIMLLDDCTCHICHHFANCQLQEHFAIDPLNKEFCMPFLYAITITESRFVSCVAEHCLFLFHFVILI